MLLTQLRTTARPGALIGWLSALLLLPSAASAQGVSADVEFIRPTFGYGSFQGVAVPLTKEPLAFRYGALVQYELNPVTLYNALTESETGSVVTNRGNFNLGASIDLSRRVTLNLVLPGALNWGAEIPEFEADGFGLSDIGVGGQAILIKMPSDRFNLGLRAGLLLPTGRGDAYMSESGLRTSSGLLAMVQFGPLRVATDAGVMTRKLIETDEDFNLSHEFQWNNGVRVGLPAATRTAITAQLMSRNVLSEFLKGGAENALEVVGGVQVMPSEAVTIDVGAGRGLTEGYGTTDLRILSAVTIQHVTKPPPPQPIIVATTPPPPPPPPPPPVEDIPDEPPVFEEGQLAMIVFDQIVIKDMLEFVVDTNILKDYSRPTLQAVADILNQDARIGHLVVEGHASQEGSFEHNYELAESRARRVWEEMTLMGVHPSRMSYRGLGEVVPIKEGEDEETLQLNRRVEFHIVRQFEAIEDMPDYPRSVRLPWNGDVVAVIQPKKPEPPKEEKPEEEKDEFDEFEVAPTGEEKPPAGEPTEAPK